MWFGGVGGWQWLMWGGSGVDRANFLLCLSVVIVEIFLAYTWAVTELGFGEVFYLLQKSACIIFFFCGGFFFIPCTKCASLSVK